MGAAVVPGPAELVGMLSAVGADPEELVVVAARGVVGKAGVTGEPRGWDGVVGVVEDRCGFGDGLVHVVGLVGAGVDGEVDDADGWCSSVRGAGSPGTMTMPA
jgi:hypothetical protein